MSAVGRCEICGELFEGSGECAEFSYRHWMGTDYDNPVKEEDVRLELCPTCIAALDQVITDMCSKEESLGNLRRCDRCGNVYEYEATRPEVIWARFHGGDDEAGKPDIRRFDLCDRCLDGFDQFMNEGGSR